MPNYHLGLQNVYDKFENETHLTGVKAKQFNSG